MQENDKFMITYYQLFIQRDSNIPKYTVRVERISICCAAPSRNSGLEIIWEQTRTSTSTRGGGAKVGQNPKQRQEVLGHPGENPEDSTHSEYCGEELRVWDPAAGGRKPEQCILLQSSPSQE